MTMNNLSKLQAVRLQGFNKPYNTTWSWGTTRDDGAVLLICAENGVGYTYDKDSRIIRLWVAGASEGQSWHTLPGNPEREQHVQAIESGADGFVLLYKQTFDARGRERGSDYADYLLRVLRLEKTDDGKVIAVCQRVVSK